MQKTQDQFAQDIALLSQHAAFARFLQNVKELRESHIRQMHDIASGANGIMQISGRVLAYDDVLCMCRAEEVIQRHREAP